MIAADVAVLAPVPGPYTYQVPQALQQRIEIGARVWVPLSGRHVEGVVLKLHDGDPPAPKPAKDQPEKPPRRLLPIERFVDGPVLPPDLLALGRFITDYYLCPHGEALRLLLPPGGEARAAHLVTLTDAGAALGARLKDALLPPEAAELPAPCQTVLGALCAGRRGKRSPRQLGHELSLAERDLRRLLATLQERGLVSITEELRAGVKVQVELMVHCTAAPEQLAEVARRAPARAAVLAQLLADGPLPLAALQKTHKDAAGLVKALASKGLARIEQHERVRDPLAGLWGMDELLLDADPGPPPTLTDEQEQALSPMLRALDRATEKEPHSGPDPAAEPVAQGPQGPGAFLLHGVTGSGKTEIYLRLIARALLRGRTALVLVPEIGLTPQLAARFRARFGPDVAVLHSALTQGERADSWRRLLRGDVRIALGPRSALFAPLRNLGVIIVDEEHDGSFKQQDGVRYQGRDVALVRARQAGAIAVLGSATPSLESLALVQTGKLQRLVLEKRATGRLMPAVQLVDLRQHLVGDDDGLLSAPLATAIEETLGAKEQVILFLNRRGYATFLLCKGCGHRFQCRHCAVTLTWHKGQANLLCHYCGYTEPLPQRCPQCHGQKIDRLGLGTQKIEEQIVSRFPGARVSRLDRDTAGGQGLPRMLLAMQRGEIDILIGTQMLAKGHDFPGVTLVGVVTADTGIGLPDFRAAERTFQLLSQVAGRAGRAQRPGRVVIQTYNPQHPAIVCACTHDYLTFATLEMQARRELFYPPVARLAALRLDGVDPVAVREAAEAVALRARAVIERAPAAAAASLLGPAEAPISRLKGRTRWQVFVRAAQSKALHTIVRGVMGYVPQRGVRLSVDVDPVSTL